MGPIVIDNLLWNHIYYAPQLGRRSGIMRDHASILFAALATLTVESERGKEPENVKRHELRAQYRDVIKLTLDNGDFDRTTMLVTAAFAAKVVADSKENFRKEVVEVGVDELASFVFNKLGKDAAKQVIGILKNEHPELELNRSDALVAYQDCVDMYGGGVRE